MAGLPLTEGSVPEASGVLASVAQLERFYGPLPSPPSDPFRYYVWDALSAQTTAVRRDAAYAALTRIPALTPDSMFRAPRAVLVTATALAGPYQEQRLHALLAGVERFRRHPRLPERIRGALRVARRAVATLPKLGDGSTHRMLLFGGGHCVVPTDRDIVRVVSRLGWAGTPLVDCRARQARRCLEAGLPAEPAVYVRVALYLRHHGVQTCTVEPHCPVCPLRAQCPASRAPA